MIVDLHNHTIKYSQCSIIQPHILIENFIHNKIDGVCITEHNILWNEKEQKQLTDKYKDKIKIFFGMEVDTDIGHVLMFGSEIKEFKEAVEIAELVKKIDRKNTALIWAHPFRSNFNAANILTKELVGNFDAIELYNGSLLKERLVYTEEKFNPYNVRFTGGSDTHASGMSVICATKFETSFDDISGLVQNLKFGNYEPVRLKRG
ncbi:MAG: hypothetical protein A2086_03680 [Spirochaetes bacterium GWD1_27_9]|nr:MAG: hypothetical protein A2Z98_10065 [Spirochaetes bacterium GWB1_27_13]OHD40296.1 MAG: hypothetical protein A2086_03680 [Spirochaetes bacterium GWD1_27_9]